MTFTVGIIGRPNVGKSTLFNRLVGKHLSIVDRTAGVTRDWQKAKCMIGDIGIELIDTAGLEPKINDGLDNNIREKTLEVIKVSDLIFFVIDAREGVTPNDQYFANQLRREKTKKVVLANKCEGNKGDHGYFEAFKLGFGEPIPISAEHGHGLEELYYTLKSLGNIVRKDDYDTEAPQDEQKDDTIKIAIVGKPNVGKSTFINCLIQNERLLTGPEAGITRDSIDISWTYKGKKIQLTDTAGIRRKSKVKENIDKLSTADTYRSIQFCHLVVLVLDSREPLDRQELALASHAIDQGRMLIIALNKWDVVKNKKQVLDKLQSRLRTSLTQIKDIPIITMSALTGLGVQELLPKALKLFSLWDTRISTSPLNKWLGLAVSSNPPPLIRGRRPALRYVTQAKTKPPAFIIFSSRGKKIAESYRRYLVNDLARSFELNNIPIRLIIRQAKNPYNPE
ncbi:MAG: GTPase Der [Alphaproteobacteria bacterium MarineAlpha3_Bin7]|nr:MAG: GTPase Der [Alphaproteobacteria bacterium MarineAlpha3_Bin7]